MMNKVHLGLLHIHCRVKVNHREKTHLDIEDTDTDFVPIFTEEMPTDVVCCVFCQKTLLRGRDGHF